MTLPALRRGALVVLSLASLAAPAAPKPKETPKKSVVVLTVPFSVDAEDGEWTGFAVAELITDLVAQQKEATWVSSKQLDAALRRKDLQPYDASDLDLALPLARTVGATDLVLGESARSGGKITLTAQRYNVATKESTRKATATGTAEELPALAAQLAQELLDVDKKTAPMTTNVKALEFASRCWLELVKTSLQPRVGPVPPPDHSAQVEQACSDALKADPAFGWAHAGAAIMKSFSQNPAVGRDEAKAARRDARFDGWLYIAESYSDRRAGDLAGARAALEAALKERPGFLTAASYLAEDRMAVEDYKGAVSAWERILKRAPNHPYALGQKAKALGYLHKDREALALTRRALEIDPKDPELLIELGSRQLDAGMRSEAEETFRRATEARPPRPLAWLRLGYLYMKQNRTQDAHDALTEAITYAFRADESRTRGMAFTDLAIVSGMENKYTDAVQYLQQAKTEGYAKLPCDAPELKAFKGKPEFDAVCAAAK